ncbi:MAG TPA: hypothetical protein VG929_03045 [Actinomycetota bacterium]|nr:hypothetical protein [Actinomycetota bacterium]
MSGTTRHCPRCRTHVEDVGGFCLLGHRLNEAARTGSLTELRAEVDRAFEDAKLQVAAAVQAVAPPPPPIPTAVTDIPAPAPLPLAAPAPTAIEPPPPAAVRLATPLVVDTEPVAGDPIADFAPAPRMDWGPERHGLRKRFG